MNRKYFLSTVLGIGAALPALTESGVRNGLQHDDLPLIIPPYLRPGDMIGITCPAGFITLAEIQPALQQIEDWGFCARIGDTVGKKDFTFGGTDAERAADLQQMLDDPSLRAILCARGDYGAVHIIDRLDLSGLLRNPKWIIGFSDITVIHSHIHRHLNMASIHSKMCNSFPDDWTKAEPVQVETILSIRKALSGEKMQYAATPHPFNRAGIAEGALVGGNLKTIETLSATASDISTAGKILFVEDTGEYLYSIDRMFWNLERTGKLARLKGLIIGGFKVKPDDPGDEYGRTLYDIVQERVKPYTYPVSFDFPVGHQKNNFALKCGIIHRLEVAADKTTLEESAPYKNPQQGSAAHKIIPAASANPKIIS
ncbi:MAG TPA: LD-carboxypeptidase [Puia sp.]|nr:LD-carboxypeptidase [Puia sp.]